MGRWVRVCGMNQVPGPGEVTEVDVDGRAVCVANVNGELHALDNVCPHRQGPLGQGWIEGKAVICPWHAWAFDVTTGVAEEPERAQVRLFQLRTEGNDLMVDLS